MSKFYGTVSGTAKTIATRTGGRNSGITTQAASWHGAIEVRIYEDEDGVERYQIKRIPWEGSGADKACLLLEGEM